MKPPDYVATSAREPLLVCGIVAAVLYPLTDIIAALRYPGYSMRSQAVSELFAIGAPTSAFVVPLFTLTSILVAAYGVGIWMSAYRRSLRWMAVVIVASAVDGLILWNFFPMHMRGAEKTLTDTMHLVFAANPFVLLSLILGAVGSTKALRAYTIATIVFIFIPAVLGFGYAPQVAANEPTPWLGALERMGQYGYGVWQAVFATALLHRRV